MPFSVPSVRRALLAVVLAFGLAGVSDAAGSPARRPEPLPEGEELEEDDTDEMSALQKEVVRHPAAEEEEDGIEEEDEYSAIQTEMVMLDRREEHGFDGASLMQSEAKVVGVAGRASASCDLGKGEATALEDDEVSLMQTEADVKVHRKKPGVGPEGCVDEGPEDDEEDEDETALFQTSVTLGKGQRRVGMGDLADDEEDAFEEDGASFMQANVGLQQGDHTAEGDDLHLGRVKVCKRQRAVEEDDEEEDDVFAL